MLTSKDVNVVTPHAPTPSDAERTIPCFCFFCCCFLAVQTVTSFYSAHDIKGRRSLLSVPTLLYDLQQRHKASDSSCRKKVFCLLFLSDKRHIKKQTNKKKREKTCRTHVFFFSFLSLPPPHHKRFFFKHWLSISLQKESSKDVNMERCKRCVGSSRSGLEQIVDPVVRDWVREASHGRRQARWRRRDEVVHRRTDGEDNRVANGALPRLNRAQGQCTVLAIWFIDAEVFFFSIFFFFFWFLAGRSCLIGLSLSTFRPPESCFLMNRESFCS